MMPPGRGCSAVLGWASTSSRVGTVARAAVFASIIPVAYAVQQRLDMDFWVVTNLDLSRANSTLGNPNFFAAYLGLLLPVSLGLGWIARTRPSESRLWWAIAASQVLGIVLTQSRGSLAASMLAIVVLCCLLAALHRARRVFFTAAVAFGIAVVFVAALNVVPGARGWVRDIPIANRFVFSLASDAGEITKAASRSVLTRLAIWQSGTDAFAAASPTHRIWGYGPDSAYIHYYPHMQAKVMQTEGYWALTTFDRLHADTLDIGLNFGLAGWLAICVLFGATLFAAARRLFSLGSGVAALLFVGTATCGGVSAFAAAVMLGVPGAGVPAFGLGIGIGWSLFFVACSLRELAKPDPDSSPVVDMQVILMAAFASSALFYWCDAQVNIPVLSTRLVVFSILALVLALDRQWSAAPRRVGKRAGNGGADWAWGGGYSLTAAFASFVPMLSNSGAVTGNPIAAWWVNYLPLVPAVLAMIWMANLDSGKAAPAERPRSRSPLVYATLCACLYLVIHLCLAVDVGTALDSGDAANLTRAVMAAPIYLVAACMIGAWLALGEGDSMELPASFRAVCLQLILVLGSCLFGMYAAWRVVDADVSAKVATWAAANKQATADQILSSAIERMPHERHYRRLLVFEALGRAVQEIGNGALAQGREAEVQRNLDVAESVGRDAVHLFPQDPWMILALANTLQARGLQLLRPYDPIGGARAAQEADTLFGRAQSLFPAQPLVLRNWAQLKFDAGRITEAYELLDRMEALIPEEVEPYSERLAIANRIGDRATINSTLARARRHLGKEGMDALMSVANQQH